MKLPTKLENKLLDFVYDYWDYMPKKVQIWAWLKDRKITGVK